MPTVGEKVSSYTAASRLRHSRISWTILTAHRSNRWKKWLRASGTHASELEMRHKKDGGGSEEPKDPPPPFFAHETLKIENLSYLLSFFSIYTPRSYHLQEKLGYDGYGWGTGREKGVEKNINDSCYFVQDILNYIKISWYNHRIEGTVL